MAFASGYAEANHIDNIFIGVNAVDYSGYPDCRPEFYQSLGESFAIGNWGSERILFHLPYIDGDKETILKDALESCNKLNIIYH